MSHCASECPRPITVVGRLFATLEATPSSLLQLLLRLGIAGVFWKSGQVKIADWQSTLFLFKDEYRVPLLPPDIAATLAAAGELAFPVLLVFGLATRLSAAALLGMTAVIQIFVYPGNWMEHLMWASILVTLIAKGPGKVSLDCVAVRFCHRVMSASPGNALCKRDAA